MFQSDQDIFVYQDSYTTIAKAALLVSYIYLDLSIDARSDLKSDLSFFIKLSAPKSKLSKLS